MALGFFRRRQKLVIIIMVALMVSFLVGSYGFNMLFSTDPMKEELGQTRYGELVRADFVAAQADLDVLGNIGLGGNPFRYPPWPTEMEYFLLTRRNGDRAHHAYALLLQEARSAGIVASQADVDAFFAQLGYSGEDYQSFLSTVRAAGGWPESHVRRAIQNWLLISKAFAEFGVNCPPSEAQTALAFRNVKEEINIRVLRLKAADYLKEVPDPNEARITKHFNLYRARFPGQTRKVNDMGFGYREPGRAQIQYLLVRGDVIRRVTEPAFDQVVDYYNQHKDEFIKKVPATGSATGPAASQPSSRPAREVPMNFAEAKGRIVEKLRTEAAEARMDEVVVFAEGKVRQFLQGAGDPNQAYETVCRSMTRSAEKALATIVRGVKIADMDLDEAVARLAEAAKLKAICYPWGTHGGDTLLPTVKVSLAADGIPLGEALGSISLQAKWPAKARGKLRWATCEGFKDVLFSVGDDANGVDFFPLAARQTPLRTYKELSEDEVLGYARANPAGGQTLPQTAFSVKELSANPRERPMVQLGAAGPRMYAMGDKPGRLIWRLVAADPPHSPAMLGIEPSLRQRVVDDLKLLDAFRKAEEDAGKLKKAAETVGLETIAGARKVEVFATGFFARQKLDMSPPDLPKLELDTRELLAYVVPKVFALAPKKVDGPPAKDSPGVAVIAIPVRGEVLVVERIGFKPVLRPEYDGYGRVAVARLLHGRARQQLQALWFDLRSIFQRVGFTRE